MVLEKLKKQKRKSVSLFLNADNYDKLKKDLSDEGINISMVIDLFIERFLEDEKKAEDFLF